MPKRNRTGTRLIRVPAAVADALDAIIHRQRRPTTYGLVVLELLPRDVRPVYDPIRHEWVNPNRRNGPQTDQSGPVDD